MGKERSSRTEPWDSPIVRGQEKEVSKTDRGQWEKKKNPGVWMPNEQSASDKRNDPLCQKLLSSVC